MRSLMSRDQAPFWHNRFRHHRQQFGALFSKRPRQLGVRAVAGFHRDDMAADRRTKQRKVADDVENLVARKLVLESQRVFAQHRFVADHNGALETAALDQVLLHERFHVLVINKCPGGGDFLRVNLRRDFDGEELREPSVRPDLSAGNAEFVVGNDGHEGPGFCLEMKRLMHLVNGARRGLGDDARLPDQLDEGLGAAVADGRLVGVHLDDDVIDLESGQRRQDMLDGMEPSRFPRRWSWRARRF